MFTIMGRVVAIILLILAVSRLTVFALILTGRLPETAVGRYLGGDGLAAETDRSFELLFIAIALGILVEISSSLKKR